MRERIEKLGWYWRAPYGWTHDEVTDDSGHRRYFGDVEEVCEYLQLEEIEA
jgi:hypothetical protein